MELLIRNAALAEAGGALSDVLTANGLIAGVYPAGEAPGYGGAEVIDAGGKLLLPGLVDMHCTVGEPGYEHKEDIESVSKSAAKGGFTSITCQPCTKPVIDNKTTVSYIMAKSRCARVNIFIYGSMTKGCKGKEIAEIGEMARMGAVALSDGKLSVADADLMRNILLYSKMFDIPVITLCDDASLSGGGVMHRGVCSVQTGLGGIPREAEEVMVARNLILAAGTGARLHITHVSTAGSVDMIRHAKQRGVSVTCDTCPHYFTLTDGAVNGYNTFAKVRPPLREARDLEAVKEGIADGTVDVIASGHSPEIIDSKRTVFDKAAFGISSLETALAVSYTALVATGLITLSALTEKMAVNPSRILGLERKAAVKEGADADLIIFDGEASFEVNPAAFASKARYSPYAGARVKGAVVYTITNGKVVYKNT